MMPLSIPGHEAYLYSQGRHNLAVAMLRRTVDVVRSICKQWVHLYCQAQSKLKLKGAELALISANPTTPTRPQNF